MRRSTLYIMAIALLTCFLGLAACNGGDDGEDTGVDTGPTADAGDTGGDATSDAGDTGPTRAECLDGDPLGVFCTGSVRPECQQYCEDVDAGSPDGGQEDGGATDAGEADTGGN